VISCAVGPTVAAGEPLTIDKDNPAAPNNGTAHARLFRFDVFFPRDMLASSRTFGALKDRLSGEMRRGKAYPSVALNVKYRQSFHAAWSSPTASGQGCAWAARTEADTLALRALWLSRSYPAFFSGSVFNCDSRSSKLRASVNQVCANSA
jgi:hypothetical protein